MGVRRAATMTASRMREGSLVRICLPRKAGEGDHAPQRAWWRGRDGTLSLGPPLTPPALRGAVPLPRERGRQGKERRLHHAFRSENFLPSATSFSSSGDG